MQELLVKIHKFIVAVGEIVYTFFLGSEQRDESGGDIGGIF